MTFEAVLKAHLQDGGAIEAIVADRITPQPVPQGTRAGDPPKACITYLVVQEDPQSDLDGEDGQLLEIRVQVDCWASTQTTVRELAELVRLRMKTSSFRATPTPGSSFGDYEQQSKLHRFSRDFTCWYRTT